MRMNVYMCRYIDTCIFFEQRHPAKTAVDLALRSHLNNN